MNRIFVFKKIKREKDLITIKEAIDIIENIKDESLCRLVELNKDNPCTGYQISEYDDEPCEMCKRCIKNEFYEK